jgi:hypothetical protein
VTANELLGTRFKGTDAEADEAANDGAHKTTLGGTSSSAAPASDSRPNGPPMAVVPAACATTTSTVGLQMLHQSGSALMFRYLP